MKDREDGSTEAGEIAAENLAINFDYAPEGFDPIEIAQNHVASDAWVTFSRGRNLIDKSDCLSCHRVDVKSIGPSYIQVAEKYKNDPKGQAIIADRIINGSVGVWGEHAMSAHPNLSKKDAELMIEYIMSLNEPQAAPPSYPLAGILTTQAPKGTDGKGGYLLRAAYTDKGTDKLEAISSEKIIALRNPKISPEQYDDARGVLYLTTPRPLFNMNEHNGYLAYHDLDLTGIKEIIISAEANERNGAAGAIIEVRLDSEDGQLLGTTEKVEPVNIDIYAEVAKYVAAWEKGGKKGPRPNRRSVQRMLQPIFTIPVNDINTKHNVYFVFKNPEAKEGQILVRLYNIEFSRGKDVLQ
ncbi:MAG: c-type cytochrome [Bacteroidota bacterium]